MLPPAAGTDPEEAMVKPEFLTAIEAVTHEFQRVTGREKPE
jgi:hypothetical protein